MEGEKVAANGCSEVSQPLPDAKDALPAIKQNSVQPLKNAHETSNENQRDPPNSDVVAGAPTAPEPTPISNSRSTNAKASKSPPEEVKKAASVKQPKKSPAGNRNQRRTTRNSPNNSVNLTPQTNSHKQESAVPLPVAHKSSPDVTQLNQNVNCNAVNFVKSKSAQRIMNNQLSAGHNSSSSSSQSPHGHKSESNAKLKRKRVKSKGRSPSRSSDEPRVSKRVRLQYQPFQSPESISLAPTFYRPSPSTRNLEDKIVVFNRGDFLAVRNESGSFYVCRTAQNVYKTSKKFKIQWLNDEKDPNVYIPDFYDQTDFECVLTNLRMVRLDKRKYKLPNEERQRIMNILERALNVERGVSEMPDPRQVAMDGVDVSIVGKAEEQELIKISPKIEIKPESKHKGVGRPKKKVDKEKAMESKVESKTRVLKPHKRARSANSRSASSEAASSSRRTTRSSVSSTKSPPQNNAKTPKPSPKNKRLGLDSVVRKLRSKARISNQSNRLSAEKASIKTSRAGRQKQKVSPNRKSSVGLSEVRKQKAPATLQPKPHVTFYERDPTFESPYGEMPYISSLAQSRLLIRAVLLKDCELLERLMTEGKVCTFCVTRCLSIKRDALSYAIEREDLDSVKMLMDCKYGSSFAAYPDVITIGGNGVAGNSSSFCESSKTANPARAAKDQPNALLKDLNTDYRCQRQKMFVTQDILQEALRFGVSKSFLEGLVGVNEAKKEFTSALLLNNIVTVIRFGHGTIAGELIDVALQKGGYGFGSLHKEALVSTDGPFSSLKGPSAKKRSTGNARISPIHCAAINQNSNFLSTLLQQNPADYSLQDTDGWQPVHYAAVCKGRKPLEFLISKGISTLQTEKDGNTPLHLACLSGATHNVELILSHEANSLPDDHSGSCIERQNKSGLTPLHVAVERGIPDVVSVLLQSGADAEKPTGTATERLTPLMLAAQFGHIQIVKMLIEKGVDIEAADKRHRTALLHAVMNGHSTVVSYLLRLGVNPDAKDNVGNTAMHYAAAYGWFFCFKLLLEASSKLDEPNDCYITPIVAAFFKGHIGLVELMSEKGIDINARFHYSNGKQFLKVFGIRTVSAGITLLMEAVRSKPSALLLDRVKLLVESQNTDCKKVDSFGNNALHYLVRSEIENNNYWKSVEEGNNDDEEGFVLEDEELFAQKQEENFMRTRQKEVKRIQQNSLYEAAKILIEHGCDPRAPNQNGESALSLAAKHGCFSLMKRFVEAGCRITFTTNEEGNTILHLMVANVLQDGAAEFLYMMSKETSPMETLKEMAKTFNSEGKTPLQLALYRSKEMVRMDDSDKKKFVDFVRYLVEVLNSNVDTFLQGELSAAESCLHIAARNCSSPEVLLILLKHSSLIDPLDSKNRTPLAIALMSGNDEAAKLLVTSGANVNFRSEADGKMTVLLLAAALGRTALLPLIVSKGADVTEVDHISGNSVLHYVVKSPNKVGSFEAVRSLIGSKADVNCRNKVGQTPLHLLIGARGDCTDNMYDIEEFLLENGANITIQDEQGRLPLHYAFIQNEDWLDTSFMDPVELIGRLTSDRRNELVNVVDSCGQTALHRAAIRGATVSCTLFLSAVTNLDAVDKDGNTALGLAVYHGHRYCALKLLENGACFTLAFTVPHRSAISPDSVCKMEEKSSILQEVIRKGWHDLFHLMLDKLEIQGKGTLAAIEAAICVGRLKLAYKLISRLKDAKSCLSEKQTLFHVLSRHVTPATDEQFQLNIVRLLLAKGVFVNALDETKTSAVVYAAVNLNDCLCREFANIVGEAVIARMEPDTLLRTPFSAVFWSISDKELSPGMISWCSDLLSNGAEINPLCYYPISEVVHSDISFIVPNSVNLIRSLRKYTPLVICVIKGNYSLVKYLLHHKADINAPDDLGRTPLMHAAALNDIKMIKLLLNPRYDPEKDPKPWNSRFLTFTKTSNVTLDSKDVNGWTVVHHLVSLPPHLTKSNSDVTLRLLSRVEAPLDVADKKGVTPYQMASQLGLKEVTDTLQELMKIPK